jgi:pyruvate/2-oxoglutarate dehydrogenase complex dihydrolipoamide acyltransferase (E2) component
MSIEIKVPDLGDGLDSGDVLNVLVSEGDVVQADQGIVELETEKAVAEVPTTHAGQVTAIHVKAGQTVAIGQLLITLDPNEEPAATPSASQSQAKGSDAQSGASSETAVVSAPVESLSRAAETESPAAPLAAKPLPVAETKPAPEKSVPAAAPSEAGGELHQVAASPAMRRYARELGVDLAHISGTGPEGRITQEDIRQAVRQATQSAVSSSSSSAEATPATTPDRATPGTPAPSGEPGEDAWGPILTDRVTKIRTTIAKKMVESKSIAPHVTNFDDADITELEKVRQASKKDYAAAGIKLTTMPFVIRAVGQTLQHHQTINASLDMEAGQIIYKQYVNVGLAVDTERGLMVPVIRNADTLNIPQLARAVAESAEKARSGKIGLEEMRGGTFTISNLGAIGGTYSTPVINVPEVAILLVGRSREMPVVRDGEIQIRLMMPLSLSYDHRLVDGAAAARFLNDLKGYLEAPGRLLLAP